MFHELFPCKYSCAYSSTCAQSNVQSNVFLLWQTCSTHVHVYFHHCLHVFTACLFIYSLHVFGSCTYQHMCIVYDKRQPIEWCSMNCFHASIHAHTHQHVHRTLYTLIVLFYDKLVVHMYTYTFTIACMYSLHACSCIHSMFLDRATTNIAASSTTNRSMFHELFPCKYPCAYSSSCAQNIVHSNVFLLWQTRSTHVHIYFHHCCMYSLHACSCIHSMFSVHASTNISASSTTTE